MKFKVMLIVLITLLCIPVSFASEEVIETNISVDNNDEFLVNEVHSEIEYYNYSDDNEVENFINDTEIIFESDESLESSVVYDEDFVANTQFVLNSPYIQSNDFTKYFGNSAQFQATFLNQNYAPLANSAITFTINDVTYTRYTNSAGVALFSINLNPGVYQITVTNPSMGVSVVNTVTILSTIWGYDLVKYYRNATQYYVYLLDANGNPLSNKNVELNINGVIYTRQTDSNGRAMLSINLNPGEYVVTATHPDSGLKCSNSITVLSIISGEDLVKFFTESKVFKVNILNGQGQPASNVAVSFNVNGVIYSRNTDSSGVASLNINLNPNMYIITASYNGLSMSYDIFVYHDMVHSQNNLKITPITKYIQKGGVYKVKLTEDNGLPMSGRSVQININSGAYVYSATTNNQGIAQFTLNLNPGTYNIKASYGGYETTRSLIISAANNGFETEIIPITTSLWTGEKFSVKLTNKNTGAVLTNQNVQFYVNGVEYIRTTDNTGVASLTINFQNSGVYPITVSYAGTTSGTIYKPSSVYKLFYLANSEYDSNFINYNIVSNSNVKILTENDWIDPTEALIF